MVVFPALSRPTMITLCSEIKISLVSHTVNSTVTISTVLWNKVSLAFLIDLLSKRRQTSGATWHGPYLNVCLFVCGGAQTCVLFRAGKWLLIFPQPHIYRNNFWGLREDFFLLWIATAISCWDPFPSFYTFLQTVTDCTLCSPQLQQLSRTCAYTC